MSAGGTDSGAQNDGPVFGSETEIPEPDGPENSERGHGVSGELVEMDPPRMDTGRMRQLWRTRKHLKKREKLIGDGYVQWYLVGDAVNRPKFVKPSRKGGGIPELDHDGETYLFPRDALVPSADGMWTCVHREGEADPINIRDPAKLSLPADELKEYLDLRVSSSAPGLLDGLGLDSGDLIKLLIGGIIAYAVFQQFMGGGMF